MRNTQGEGRDEVHGVSGVTFDDAGNLLAVVGVAYFNATELEERESALGDTFGVLVGKDGLAFATPWRTEFENNFSSKPSPLPIHST